MALRNISNINTMPLPVYATEKKPLMAKNRKLGTAQETEPLQVQYQPQIRTSSPISSSTSDSFDAPPEGLFPNIKHLSIRELAYQKLREQKNANDLRQFNPDGKKHPEPSNIRSNGKLKILAYNNYGHLTVHIIKGKGYKISGDTYVKINMLPDHSNFYKHYQTPLLKRSNKKQQNTLMYDEKFSFEVNQASPNDRICVSVWAKSHLGQPQLNSLLSSTSSTASSTSSSSLTAPMSHDQLVGCFSFRIRSLMQIGPEVSEPCWYHLLPENVGTCKHFRCHRPSQAVRQKKQDVKITNVNKDLIGMRKFQMKIMRETISESFGFTVTGNCPCMVGKVDHRRQAFNSGLRPGDYIAGINGKNVSRGTCDSVVKLIKSFENQFNIEVYREPEAVEEKPVENLYYEIPMADKCVERAKVQSGKMFCLEVVPEEEEEYDSDTSEMYYSGENVYALQQQQQSEHLGFASGVIRHMDSDVNTEDERLDEMQVLEMRRSSMRYMHEQEKYSSLRSLGMTNNKHVYY